MIEEEELKEQQQPLKDITLEVESKLNIQECKKLVKRDGSIQIIDRNKIVARVSTLFYGLCTKYLNVELVADKTLAYA